MDRIGLNDHNGSGAMTIQGASKNIDAHTAYDSLTFGNPLSLRVDEGVGAMTISPCGRDVALASYVEL